MERGWFGKAEVNWLGPGVVEVGGDMVVLVYGGETDCGQTMVVEGIAREL